MDLPINSEQQLYEEFLANGLPKRFMSFGTGNPGQSDMIFERRRYYFFGNEPDWKKLLGIGLRNAVTSAVNVAAGKQKTIDSEQYENTSAQRARSWFINSYPLLGSLAIRFKIIEDQSICHRMDISVAAVHAELQEIYLNPAMSLTEEESKFVIAHELLHVGLRHDSRRQGRDPFLWNAACDYVINGWLMEMQCGDMPAFGALYDPKLKGESAESVYDIIAADLRRIRKLATLRGIGKGDMLDPQVPDWWAHGAGSDLDIFTGAV